MKPLGLQCSVGYSDQHESFGKFLPRSGIISQELQFPGSPLPCYVFTLDEPFEWESQCIDTLIISQRWVGHPIGDSDFTPLYVSLDPHHRAAAGDASASDFVPICWGELLQATPRPNQAMERTPGGFGS